MLPILSLLLAFPSPQSKPNLVVFVLDDAGPEEIASLPTPAIDGLAASGVTFSRAYSQPWCAPTRDSFLRSSWRGEFRGDLCAGPVPSNLDDGLPNMVKLLDANGYATMLVGKYHLGGATSAGVDWNAAPMLYGFDHWRAGAASSTMRPNCDPILPPSSRIDDGVISQDSEHRTIQQLEATIDAFYEAQAEGTPVFLSVGFSDPHSPWTLPPASLLPAGYVAGVTDRALYEAEIIGLDTAIGMIVAALPPDTYYVIMGDNGTPAAVDVDNLGGSKKSTLEGGVRIPLILSGPGLNGTTRDDPVHVVDVLPTFAQCAGISVPSWAVGQNLFAPVRRPWVFVQNASSSDEAVIEQEWKLRRKNGIENLYNLATDPGELTPLPATGPHADRLRAVLDGPLN